jgi:general secretion pathway protein D
MKTILPLFLLVGVAVSCSHAPQPAFHDWEAAHRPPSVTTETPPPPPPAPPAEVEAVPGSNVVVHAAVDGGTNIAVLPPAARSEVAEKPGVVVATNVPMTHLPPRAIPALPTVPTASTSVRGSEQMLPAGMIDFRQTPLEQVLMVYAELVNRTLLRPANLGGPQITLKTQTQLTKGEAIQALDTVLGLNGITIINVGDKFVKVVPVGQAPTEGQGPDSRPPNELPDFGQYVTHVVQTKFLKPSQVVPAIQPFAKMPTAIVPLDDSMILVLRDYTENVKRMLEMIEKVDVAVPSEFVTEVIPIKYALATDIQSALGSVGGGGGGTSIGSSSRGGLGGASPGANSGPGGNNPYNRTGTQTTTGAMRPGYPNGSAQPGATPGGTSTFQDRLRQIMNRAQGPGGSGAGGGEFQLLSNSKIIADERTNSLLVFATREDMAIIKDIISKLDVVLAQVLIEAIVMEVSLDDSKNIGFSYLQHPKTFGNNGGSGAINNVPFLSHSQFASVATNASGSLPSGFSYLGSLGNDFDMTVQAVSQDSRINVLSRPRIQTSHAVPAHLFVGQTFPYINGTQVGVVGVSSTYSTYEEKQVGITLDVLPLINPDGLVVMDIQEDIEQLGNTVTIDGNPVPTTTKRTANAKVAVKDRDSVILGGFISTTKSKSKSGVPFLKDIPLFGSLFRATSDSSQRVELIIMMRPTVLPNPEIAAVVARTEKNNLPGVRRAEKEIQDDENARLKASDRTFGRKTQSDKDIIVQ